MSDLPQHVMIWHSHPDMSHIGTWAVTRYPEGAVAYAPQARIEALERALSEIIMEATSRNHAIDIARRARNGDDKKTSQDAK